MRFLFVDRIIESQPGRYIRGIKHITADDFYVVQAANGHHCLIPSLTGETLGQLAAWNVMEQLDFTLRPVAGVVASARLHRPAFVGETLLLESWIENLDNIAVQYRSEARVGSDIVFTLQGALGPLLPMENFIDPNIARQQYAEINRPCILPQALDLTASPPIKLDSQRSHYKAPCMQFDRILDFEPGTHLRAEKSISRAALFFDDHFPLKPVLPLTVLLECKLNLAKEFVKLAKWDPYEVQELRKIKMNDFVYPGDVLITTISVRRHTDEELILSFLTTVAERRVCVVDIILIR